MARKAPYSMQSPHLGTNQVDQRTLPFEPTTVEIPESGATGLRGTSAIVTAEWLTRHAICPVATDANGSLRVLITSSTDPRDITDLEVVAGGELTTELGSADALERAIERFRRFGQRDDLEAVVDESSSGADADARGLASQPPVVRYVNLLVREAVAYQASDIHLEATRSGLTARLRIDGILTEGPAAPQGLHNAIVSRCKLLAGLDIAERRRPQDGRIRIRLADRELDLRVSTVPTLHGESVVIRLLDRGTRPTALSELGMPDGMLSEILSAVASPHGMILVTGPTGSGKTTTLYAGLAARSSGTEKLITVEDPVEYQIPGVTQVPVHHGSGVSFASALRAILRQDPDVVLIGELRDAETASVAVQAAMTGHLVLATLHTNDALSTFARLVDLGVPPYLLVDTVTAVVSQRLVRRICTRCIVPTSIGSDDARWLESINAGAPTSTFRGVGCEACRGTGYVGRIGLFESVTLTESLRGAVAGSKSRDLLLSAARAGGTYRPLADDGMMKALAGITTFEEVRRVVAG